MTSAAQGSFIRQVVRGLPHDWNDTLLKQVREVKVEDIKAVMREVLLPVFNAETANLFVACAPIMEEGLVKRFTETGFKPEVKSLSFFQDDYGLKGDEGGGEDGEEEDEDMDLDGEEEGEESDESEE